MNSSEPRVLATPAVRTSAAALGVDLTQVRPTGIAGRVTATDLARHSGTPTPELVPPESGWAEQWRRHTTHREGPTATRAARAAALRAGISLSQVRGTGPGGQIHTGDLVGPAERVNSPTRTQSAAGVTWHRPVASSTAEPRRAVTPSAAPGADPGRAVLTSVIEVDLTDALADPGLRALPRAWAALPALAVALGSTLQAHPALTTEPDRLAVELAPEGHGRIIEHLRGRNAAELTDWLAQESKPERSGSVNAAFSLSAAGENVILDTPSLPPGAAAALSIGSPSRRPSVVGGPAGENAISVRTICLLALTHDERLLGRAPAQRFLADLRSALSG